MRFAGGLPDHVGVAEHPHALFRNVLQRQARIGHEGLVRGHDARDELAYVDDFFLHGVRAVFQPRKLEQGVHQAAQALHFGVHRLQTLLVGFEHAVHHGLHRRLDGHERRPQLVRHVGGQAPFQLAVLLYRFRHLVERLAQTRDLVFALQPRACGQVAFFYGARRLGHAVDGCHQVACEQEADAGGQDDGRHGGEHHGLIRIVAELLVRLAH